MDFTLNNPASLPAIFEIKQNVRAVGS